MTDGLTKKDRAGILSALQELPRVRRAVLFGSRAMGTFRAASDVDLALEGEDLTLADLLALKAKIAQTNLPIEVDLLLRDQIENPDLEQHIQQYGKEWYRREGEGDLTGKWKKTSLREAGVSLIDCDHRTPPAAESGYPYVMIPQLKGGRLDLSNVRRISSEHFAEWTRKAKPKHHDVILSRRCNPGETAYVPPVLDCALGQNLVLLRSDGKKLFPPFLRWFVRGPAWWEQVGTFINVGAVFDSLKCADIPNFRMQIPPLPEQRAIAGVLGALDDKIECNRRTSETLERLARAIFRAWFVDFEPVKVKATGARSFPGMPQTAFDALPTRLVPSELGPIPEGWRVGKMGDIGRQRREQVSPADVAEGTAYIGLEHMPRRSIALSEWGTADTVTSAKSRFSRGDVLFGKLRPYFHKVGPAPVNGVCSTDIVVLEPKNPDAGTWLLMVVSSDEFVSHANQTSAGTKMPRTNWKDMANFSVAVPPTTHFGAFQEIATPMLDLIIQSIHESRRLSVLRDYLLPKLLSGKVRLS